MSLILFKKLNVCCLKSIPDLLIYFPEKSAVLRSSFTLLIKINSKVLLSVAFVMLSNLPLFWPDK